jgi:catechol 2,3-dioxygenase
MTMETKGLAAPDTAAAPLRVESVALTVRDIDRAEAFYRTVLGLRVFGRSAGMVDLGAGDPDDGAAPLLRLVHRPDALPDDPRTAGLYHTAFLLRSPADLASWLGHAENLRYPLEGAAEHLVSQSIYLADPEGNGVEIYADAPRETWVWDGPLVKFSTLPLDGAALRAKARAPWAGAPDGMAIGHIHLRVGDVEAAERFYRDAVGFTTVARRRGAVFMSTGGYHHHIALNTWQSAGAGRRDPHRAGLVEITLGSAERGPAQTLEDPWGTRVRVQSGPRS